MVVFADHDERQPLHGGEVQPFMERPGRGPAVADIHQADPRLAAQLKGQRDPRHHRDHVAEMGNLAEIALLEVVEVDVQLATVRGAVGLGHVLPEDFDGLSAHHEQGPKVTDQRRQHVLVLAALQRIRRGDRFPLLAERAEQAPDDLRLAVQRHQPLFECPREAEVVVDLEELVWRQHHPGWDGRRRTRRRKSHGPKL